MKASYHRETYLTDEILKELGFYIASDFLGQKSWRIKFPYYNHIMQITIRPDFHRTNPNCGIFSLIIPEVYDSLEPGNNPNEKEFSMNIAYHVDTAERLHAIMNSLTHINLY
jgi:hypothetical protein